MTQGNSLVEDMARAMDAATPDQIERANAAVAANMIDDATPKYGSAQGYACALTAIIQTDAVLKDRLPADDRELVERGARQLYKDYEETTDGHVARVFSPNADPIHKEVADEMRELFRNAFNASGAADRIIALSASRDEL